jgi:hypothetical protein
MTERWQRKWRGLADEPSPLLVTEPQMGPVNISVIGSQFSFGMEKWKVAYINVSPMCQAVGSHTREDMFATGYLASLSFLWLFLSEQPSPFLI